MTDSYRRDKSAGAKGVGKNRERGRKAPFYRVVAFDSRPASGAPAVNEVHHFDPTADPPRVRIELKRIEHWQGKGVQLSPAVANLVKAMRTGQYEKSVEMPKSTPAQKERALASNAARTSSRSLSRANAREFLTVSPDGSLSPDEVSAALSAQLGSRAWLLDFAVTPPIFAQLAIPAEISEEELVDLFIDVQAVSVDLMGIDLARPPLPANPPIALLGLYPSGAVRSIEGTIALHSNSLSLIMSDLSAFLDPGSPLDALPEKGLICELTVIGVESIYHVT